MSLLDKDVRRLGIDKELASNLRALTQEEFSQLERSILDEGCREPIVVWREGDAIADGHNRYRICAANGIPFGIEYLSRKSKEEVLEWQRDNQLAKRNLTAQEVSYYRGRDYLAAKKPQGAPQGNANAAKQSGQNDHFKSEDEEQKTAEKVAEKHGVSEKTARRDAEYAAAVDKIAAVFGEEFRTRVLAGQSKLTKSDVVDLVKNVDESPELVRETAELLMAEHAVGDLRNAFHLARVKTECGPKTWEALWEQPDEDAKVRFSVPQLKHLLELARKGSGDEVTADLVEIVESGQPGANNKPISSVQKAHEFRQRERKEAERERKREENRARVAQSCSPEPGETFTTIAIDPPWDWGDEGDVDQLGRAKPTYATMSIDDISALPVGELADENAHIYLWITNRSLPKGFRLLDEWGFRYITTLTWVKPSFGMGNYFRGSTEHVLFGVRGSLALSRRDLGTHFYAPRPSEARHSAKPSEFYEIAESASPAPYLEMFARSSRPGWKVWGAEASEAEGAA